MTNSIGKESQLDEIERLAVSFDASERTGIDLKLFQPGGLYYEMRRDLEVAHQANTEISKHNQELSKENERLKQEIKQAYEQGRQDMDELWKVDDE